MTNDEDEAAIEIKERSDPKQAYRITMVIDMAPGPFAQMEGSAQYAVENHAECGKLNLVSGTRSRITTSPPLRWTEVAAHTYETMVHPDLLIDGDYYGNGVCHWRFTRVHAHLKATGAQIETQFIPNISAEEILAETTKTLYFWKGLYPTDTPPPSDGKGFPEFGDSNLDNVPAERKPEFFAITLTARKAQP